MDIRVSTKYQAEDGLSLEFQEKEIKNYANSNNLKLVKIFYDKGKSGREMKTRKELQEVEIDEYFDSVVGNTIRNVKDILLN